MGWSRRRSSGQICSITPIIVEDQWLTFNIKWTMKMCFEENRVSSTIPYMALRLSMPFCFLGPFVEKTGPEKERHPDYMPISSISREWQKYNKRPIQKKDWQLFGLQWTEWTSRNEGRWGWIAWVLSTAAQSRLITPSLHADIIKIDRFVKVVALDMFRAWNHPGAKCTWLSRCWEGTGSYWNEWNQLRTYVIEYNFYEGCWRGNNRKSSSVERGGWITRNNIPALSEANCPLAIPGIDINGKTG